MEKIMEKIENGRQYRSMQMEARTAENNDEMIVRGYATTFNQPYTLWSCDGITVMEQVDSRAFDDCDMSDVIMQYDHQGRVYARLSNNTLRLNTDEHGLLIEADLSGTADGRNLYEEIRGGYTTKMSFGFTVTESKMEITENNENGERTYLRTISKIGKLYDVSAVSLPANDATEISVRNLCDGVIAEVEAERLLKAENERKRKKLAMKLRLMEV